MRISGFYDEASGNLDEQIALVKQLNEQYLCPRNISGKAISNYSFEEFESQIKPKLVENNIKLSSLGSNIGKVGINDDEAFNAQVKKLEQLLKMANSMDCKYIRMFSFHMPKDEDPNNYLDAVVKKLKVFVDMAQKYGVTLIHENEKKIFGDTPQRCLALIENINSENFKLCYDSANYVQCSVDPLEAYELTKPHTVYFHVKDCSEYKIEMPLGTGICHFEKVIKELKENNFDGFLTLEPHVKKYVQLRRLLTVLPIMQGRRKSYKQINKAKNKNFFSKITKTDVFIWQYDALKEMIVKA
ncbi:MAG: sugar phosphate isomerase/epimerase family protein [Clostridia bacterium]